MRLSRNRGSSVSITLSLGLDDRGMIPGEGKEEIFLFAIASRPAMGPA